MGLWAAQDGEVVKRIRPRPCTSIRNDSCPSALLGQPFPPSEAHQCATVHSADANDDATRPVWSPKPKFGPFAHFGQRPARSG